MADDKFNSKLMELVIGLQTMAWSSLGKQMNPQTGKVEVNLDMARDAIDTLLMIKEKTKGNLTSTEEEILKSAMQDLEVNFIEVAKKEESKVDKKTEDNPKESDKKD